MPGYKIQADYDSLENIANQFAQQASQVEQLSHKIDGLVGNLENGGWIGRGANAFYGEMHDDVLPAVQRLCRALEDGSNAIKQISNLVSQAEQDAGSLFSRR